MGSPTFAVPSLTAIFQDAAFELLAVITNPGRPAGRGMAVRPTPVNAEATRLGLPVYELADLRKETCEHILHALAPADVNVVVASGHFIPRWLRELPRFGSVNLHPSLLPRWRGAAPIQRAIMAGDDVTGSTVIQVVKEMDAGPILAQAPEPIRPDDSYGSLSERLARSGAALLVETVKGLAAGTVRPREQSGEVTYAPKIGPEDRRIKWSEPAETTERRVRALYPAPCAYFEYAGARVQVLRARAAAGEAGRVGVAAATAEEVVVGCNPGLLALVEVKPEGKGAMSAGAFARGRRISIGTVFK